MKLPGAELAIVDQSKVVAYLLSESHPDGRSKAVFFSALGFSPHRWQTFARALREHGGAGEVASVSSSAYGKRYSVDGAIETPDGRDPWIRTVWIIDSDRRVPRLVTAHPLRKPHASRT